MSLWLCADNKTIEVAKEDDCYKQLGNYVEQGMERGTLTNFLKNIVKTIHTSLRVLVCE